MRLVNAMQLRPSAEQSAARLEAGILTVGPDDGAALMGAAAAWAFSADWAFAFSGDCSFFCMPARSRLSAASCASMRSICSLVAAEVCAPAAGGANNATMLTPAANHQRIQAIDPPTLSPANARRRTCGAHDRQNCCGTLVYLQPDER